MLRSIVLATLIIVGTCQTATAKEWARKMFQDTNHDFGVLAKGAKAEFDFQLKNIYKEEVHIASVRTSCSCTTPVVTKQTLKTLRNGGNPRKIQYAVLTRANAMRNVNGRHRQTLSRRGAVDRGRGYIRRDVVFEPGIADFGRVGQRCAEADKTDLRSSTQDGTTGRSSRSRSRSLLTSLGTRHCAKQGA